MDVSKSLRLLFVLPGYNTGPCISLTKFANLINQDILPIKQKSDLLRLIRNLKNYDYIVTYSPSWFTSFSCLLGKKSIVHLGGIPEVERKKSLWRLLKLDWPLHYALKHCTQIWYNDDPEVERYARRYNKDSLEIINSIDTQKFKPDQAYRNKARYEYGIEKQEFVLGIIGPFEPVYNLPGLKWLLDVQKLLSIQKILVIGASGFDMSNPRLIFAGNNLDEDQYINAIRAMDCLIVPRFIKTLCPQSKVLEAMSCGLPVVQTNNSTPPQGSIHKESIFVCNDRIEMIGTVNLLANYRSYADYVGKRAREIILLNYSQENTLNQLRAAITKLV